MNRKTKYAIRATIADLLKEVGEDISRDGLIETPARFEKQIKECLAGYAINPKKHLKLFESDFHDLVKISKISFSSLCEHHLLPFYGYVDIAYIPNGKILGLSKFARIVDTYCKRLQTQERLTQEIADFLNISLKPELLMVRINASHSCMTIRGVIRPESITETFVTVGNVKSHQPQFNYFCDKS